MVQTIRLNVSQSLPDTTQNQLPPAESCTWLIMSHYFRWCTAASSTVIMLVDWCGFMVCFRSHIRILVVLTNLIFTAFHSTFCIVKYFELLTDWFRVLCTARPCCNILNSVHHIWYSFCSCLHWNLRKNHQLIARLVYLKEAIIYLMYLQMWQQIQ